MAKGRVLSHEYAPGKDWKIPQAQPAWRYLLE
jgi:hypothetical protein